MRKNTQRSKNTHQNIKVASHEHVAQNNHCLSINLTSSDTKGIFWHIQSNSIVKLKLQSSHRLRVQKSDDFCVFIYRGYFATDPELYNAEECQCPVFKTVWHPHITGSNIILGHLPFSILTEKQLFTL